MKTLLQIIAGVFIGLGALGVLIGLIFLGAFIMAWPLMWAWNYIIPAMFGLAELSYWQSFSMYIVVHILIKSTQTNTNNSK
jgi:hypothetical protein